VGGRGIHTSLTIGHHPPLKAPPKTRSSCGTGDAGISLATDRTPSLRTTHRSGIATMLRAAVD